MPHISVKMLKGRTEEQKKRLSSAETYSSRNGGEGDFVKAEYLLSRKNGNALSKRTRKQTKGSAVVFSADLSWLH